MTNLKGNNAANGGIVSNRLFNEFNLEGKLFFNYKLDKTKSLLIIKSNSLEDDVNDANVNHELMIYDNIKINYNKDLIVDFNKELYTNNEFTSSKKREILKVLNDLYCLSEKRKSTHSESAKRYNCFNLGLVFPSIVISAASGILSFISSSDVITSAETKHI